MEEYKPEKGIWKLISPNNCTFYADSPLHCIRKERDKRVPKEIQQRMLLKWLEEEEDCEEEKDIKITILPINEMPAFATYVNQSVNDENGVEIALNFRSILFSIAEEGESAEGYKIFFADCVVHEMLHMIQDIFDKAFDEDEVEKAILAARMYIEKEKKNGNGQD